MSWRSSLALSLNAGQNVPCPPREAWHMNDHQSWAKEVDPQGGRPSQDSTQWRTLTGPLH
jgi:hypothetical protein